MMKGEKEKMEEDADGRNENGQRLLGSRWPGESIILKLRVKQLLYARERRRPS